MYKLLVTTILTNEETPELAISTVVVELDSLELAENVKRMLELPIPTRTEGLVIDRMVATMYNVPAEMLVTRT